MADDEISAIDSPTLPAKRDLLRRRVLWTLVGAAIGAAGIVAALRALNYDPTPLLTPAIFEAEHLHWQRVAPPNYDIEIEVTGPQAAVYRAQVRDGQPQAAWRNGNPLTQRRTFGTWSVPGMFSTISRDVEAVERRVAGRAEPGAMQLILRAEFDERYHFPRRYRRTEWGSRRGSTAREVKWIVTTFDVIENQPRR